MSKMTKPLSGIEALALYDRLAPAERAEVDALIAADKAEAPWRPLMDMADPERITPQAAACYSEADILGYGGAAGGGKSNLLVGVAATQHRRSILFRRQHNQLSSLTDQAVELFGRDGFRELPPKLRLAGGRMIDFGGMQTLGDERSYQGRPYDFMGFDEATEFLESQFRFVITWNRPGPGVSIDQRCRVVAAFNPPQDALGEWVIKFWGPWLDRLHPNPALPGELRWFISIGDRDKEVDGPDEVDWQGEVLKPRSRTFIPSSVEDNPFLMAAGYKSVLQALPEPLRSQMLKGDFLAGRADDPFQAIPTAWVEAAFKRWEERGGATKPRNVPMTQVGVDVAQGGPANTVFAVRYDNWVAPLIVKPGVECPDAPTTAAFVVATLRDRAHAAIDTVGPGGAVYGHLVATGVPAASLAGAEQTQERDRTGAFGFFNKRSEWWWRAREALDPDYGDDLALPPDHALKADLCAPRWRRVPKGIRIEAKEETIKRIGRSPDRGDAVVYSLAKEPAVNPLRSEPDERYRHRRALRQRATPWAA